MISQYEKETINEYRKLTEGTIAQADCERGLIKREPLIICMDALLRYARAYRKQYDSFLSNDGFLGEEWLKAATGIRALLNGQGAIAMEMGLSNDSKDNGVVEAIFWAAMDEAGFKEEDI